MNKKLEEQFNDYYYRNYAYITSRADTKEIVKSIAQHFYNIALADVRGECEKLKEGIGIGLCEYEMGEDNGRMETLIAITQFIDNLTK